MTAARPSRHDIAAWILAGIALVCVLLLRLLPALLGGLLVYELTHMLARRFQLLRIGRRRGKVLAVALLSAVIIAVLTLSVIGTIAFFRSDAGSLSALLKKMADILDTSSDRLPEWLAQYLPTTAERWQAATVEWLRAHAAEVRTVGAEAGRVLAHVLIGMVIGGLIALREAASTAQRGPLAAALLARAEKLGSAFRRIVFAQVRISALNTALTAVYLAIVLPLLGVHLPLTKTMIAVTFVAGLLPVIGNLISNTVIFVVSLSYSLGAAVGSLLYLIVIHKLEYFVNARIIGTQIRAAAWELLLAMLVMEAAFGVRGVIAAPIFYAYIKDELSSRGLI